MMSNLPLEILSYIMSYLDFSSRRESSLVCRSWYEATLDPVFLKQTKCTFDASILDDEIQCNGGSCTLSGCLIKSPNLYITGLDENFNAKYFLKLHKSGMRILGPHVELLSLQNSNLLESTLIQVLQLCPNLKSLNLSGCNALFMSGAIFTNNSLQTDVAKQYLQNLISLSLSSRYMNDAMLCHLFDICPAIQSINLSSNNLICNSLGVSKKNSLTFLVVAQLLSQRAKLIKDIDLSQTSIVSDALSMLAIIQNLDLHTVVLQNCRELTDKGIVDLVSHQRNITSLDLTGCSEIGNASICAVCDNLCNLKMLRIRKCSKVTSNSVKNLNKLIYLEELDISECHEVSMAGLQSGLEGMRDLRILKLKCCNLSRFNESFFLPFSNSLDENSAETHTSMDLATSLTTALAPPFLAYALQHLDIGSSQYVDDVTVQAVSTHLVNLEVLKLSWSPSVTDRGLLGLPPERSIFLAGQQATSEQAKIEKLDFNEAVVLKSLKERGLVRLTRLRHLALANCKKLSPLSLLYIFRYNGQGFSHLEHLDLGMLTQAVNDDVLKAMSTSSRLRSLSLSFCSKVSDDGLKHLCGKLRFLEKLDISNCDHLTESFIPGLSQSCPWLKELDMSLCKRIPSDCVEGLKEIIPSLHRIHTRYTGGANLAKTL